jgi:hypothetical protein
MGRGHSGSTVLDLLLGNADEVQSTGELTSGFRRRWEVCSCGHKIDACEFWGPVRRDLERLHPDCDIDAYSGMLNYMDRVYRIPQMISPSLLPGRIRRHYAAVTRDLLTLIAERSGRRYVVDSSKEFARACFMLRNFPGQVKVIHLVRDGRGVMWSVLRRLRSGQPFRFMRVDWKPKAAWPVMITVAASWVVGVLIGAAVGFGQRNVLTVRYEDLCERGERELERIGRFLGVDLRPVAKRVADGEPLHIRHNVGGNNMRRDESHQFTFRADYKWHDRLPRPYHWMFLLLAFPVNWWYGYFRGYSRAGRAR